MKTFASIVIVSICAFLTASFAPKIAPSSTVKTVVIDAGHGGKDPGCHGKFAKEKDVALAISLRLGKLIEKYCPGVKVVYTRKTDVFIELAERANIANRNNADLFICIHCNSACVRDKKTKKDICKGEIHGSETYVMGLHRSESNLNVAARENESALLEGDYEKKYESLLNSDEARMVLTVYQNLHRDRSINFAQKVQDQFRERCGRRDKEVNEAGFLVLWKTAMPSVLIETGFLTNEDEEKFLASEKGQDYMASAIFRAFREWKDEVEGTKTKYSDEIEKQPRYVNENDTAALKPVKADTVKNDPPKIDPPKPAEKPVFKVQILSSVKKLDPKSSQLKSFSDLDYYEDKGIFKYTVGTYGDLASAKKRQDELRAGNFKEAFVVAFVEGKRVPVSVAEKMLK